MRKHIQINIPKPCHESWDKMKPAEKGRFCYSCQKQVVDFTKMNDLQVLTFFKKSSGSLCGRFMQNQLDRNIDIPQKRIPWMKYFFQFFLPGFILSCGSRAVGKVNVSQSKNEIVNSTTYNVIDGLVKTEPEIITKGEVAVMDSMVEYKEIGYEACNEKEIREKEELGNITLSSDIFIQGEPSGITTLIPKDIQGHVVGDNDQPIPYASVFIKGTTIGTAADSLGNFILKYNGADKYITLEGSSVGFENSSSVFDIDNKDEKIILTLGLNELLGDVIVAGWIETKGRVVTGGVGSVKKISILDTILNKILPAQKMLHLFPNPVKRKTALTIELNKPTKGNYLFQLVALSGQIIFTKENLLDKNERVIKIDIPQVAAGVYFLKATHKQSGKAYSEKIMVE